MRPSLSSRATQPARRGLARPSPRTSPTNRRSAGFSIIELMISVMVLVIGLMCAVTAGVRISKLQSTTQEYEQAHNTSRDVLEKMRNGDLSAQYEAYADAPAFDSGDQQVQVTFPAELLDEALGGAVPATARFRDMDADGDVDFDAASTDPGSLLPVRVSVVQEGFRFRMDSLIAAK